MTGLMLIAAHMVGDYITQNDWMAAHKLTDWRVRALHVTAYTLGFAPVAWWAGLAVWPAVAFLALVWVTHFITDSRRWASGEKWPPKPILVDQAIHLTTLAVLGAAFGL